jgi:hypothetical protein
MPSDRRSNRLANKPLDGELPAKRMPKPNTNSLESFNSTQAPVRQDKRRKRPRKAPVVTPEPSPEKEAQVLASDAPAPSSPAIAVHTPLAKRPKTIAAPPFDPQSLRDDYPHKVSLTITPSINGESKAAVLKTIDINDVYSDDLEKLQQHVYTKRIQPWEDIRSLKAHEKCQALHWTVTIGNPKGHHSVVQVEDKQEWEDVLAQLRQMEHSGDRKNCYKLTIEAVYKSHSRNATPPPITDLKKNKSQKGTVRNTPLIDPAFIEISSDVDNSEDLEDDDYDIDSDGLPMTQKKPARRPRDSATSRQLAQLRAAQEETASTDVSLARTRSRLLAVHMCTEMRCENVNGMCFKSKRGTHHRVTPPEKEAWAQAVVAKAQHASLEKPPRPWLKRYMEGHNETTIKRSGNKKQATPTPAPVAPEKSIQVHNHMPAHMASFPPQMPAHMASFPPQMPAHMASFPPQYYLPPQMSFCAPSQASLQAMQLDHPRPALRPPPNLPPSSPIRSSGDTREQVATSFGIWLLSQEREPVIRGHIEKAIEVIKDELFDLDQVKGGLARQVLMNAGVKGGIAIGIAQRVSEFKKHFKAERDITAAQDLMKLGQGKSGNDSDDGDDGDDDSFFQEY